MGLEAIADRALRIVQRMPPRRQDPNYTMVGLTLENAWAYTIFDNGLRYADQEPVVFYLRDSDLRSNPALAKTLWVVTPGTDPAVRITLFSDMYHGLSYLDVSGIEIGNQEPSNPSKSRTIEARRTVTHRPLFLPDTDDNVVTSAAGKIVRHVDFNPEIFLGEINEITRQLRSDFVTEQSRKADLLLEQTPFGRILRAVLDAAITASDFRNNDEYAVVVNGKQDLQALFHAGAQGYQAWTGLEHFYPIECSWYNEQAHKTVRGVVTGKLRGTDWEGDRVWRIHHILNLKRMRISGPRLDPLRLPGIDLEVREMAAKGNPGSVGDFIGGLFREYLARRAGITEDIGPIIVGSSINLKA